MREHNTRKNSRTNTTRDLVNGLLVSPDPRITSLRNLKTGPSPVISVSSDLEVRASDQECRPRGPEVRAQLEWGLRSACSCPATTGVDRMGCTDVDVGGGIGLRVHR